MFKKILQIIVLSCLFLAIVSLFDKTLAVSIMFIVFLTATTFLILKKTGFKTKTIYILFLIAFSIHLGTVFFIHYTGFQPFSGGAGDYSEYDVIARQISERIIQGNFSLQGIEYGHFYPVIIGYIYTLTLPQAFIGQIFNAWLVALLVIFIYLIVLEIGGSKKDALLAGLVVSIYPSLLFFGSLLLKDVLVGLLALIVLFLIFKVLKDFSWPKFLIFYIFLGALIHFRIYIGFAAIITFVVCWFIFSNIKIKKRLIYGILFIFLLGFLPNYSGGQGAGQGYYGTNVLKVLLNPGTITQYREFFSISNPKISSITEPSVADEPSVATEPSVADEPKPSGFTDNP
ncbi:MAG: glycosyltransferase family 39 protein, partial [Patescibacteria group bacterium]